MPKLAALGGEKTVTRQLGKSWPIWDDRDRQALVGVLESGKWGRSGFDYFNEEGSKLFQFERRFAQFHDQVYGLAVATGTVALETCLRALGVEAGDEVIVPAFTYIASASCALQCNAVPLFVDVDPETYTLDTAAVEAAISDRTRAIIAVDLGGMPCDMDRLTELAQHHDVALLTDGAHAHASQWRGKASGAWATMAAYSCMPGKTFAIGEGGMVTTNSEELYERAFRYHHAGRVRGAESPEHSFPATTLRLSEFEAALGVVALDRLAEQASTRDRNVRYLIDGLADLPGLNGLRIPEQVTLWNPFRWHFRFLSDEFDGCHRDQFVRALQAEGVPCAIGPTRPLYWFSMFRSGEWGRTGCPVRCPLYGREIDYSQVSCPQAERIHTTEAVDLQHRLLLGGQDDMDLILAALHKIRDNPEELRRVPADPPLAPLPRH